MVADLFAGSGVVARRLAHSRPVLASDIQEYSRVLASALLRPSTLGRGDVVTDVVDALGAAQQPWLKDLVDWERESSRGPDLHLHLAASIEGGAIAVSHSGRSGEHLPPNLDVVREATGQSNDWTTLRHYGGVYFSYEQAANLDVMASVIRRLDQADRDTALAALLSTATDLANSVGSHFAQPIRPRSSNGSLKTGQLNAIATARRHNAMDVFIRKLQKFTSLSRPLFDGTAIRASFENVLDTLSPLIGTVYADPPYTREHYSRFYHVLETLALGDDPGISMVRQGGLDVPSRGIYRLERHQSPFSIVSKAPPAFDELFKATSERGISLVLSYSPVPENDKPRARVIGMNALLELANARFSKVQVLDAGGMRHSKFNNRALNAPPVDEAEVLILCT
ncbi:MAG: putative restriction-modification system methyltransferase [Rhodoglobus sp.]|nr:putative restriction-modification system methyltransferase [Rhodoglobus sp.]